MKTSLTRNRVLSVFLSLCMILSLLPTAAFAVETDTPAASSAEAIISDIAVEPIGSNTKSEPHTEHVCSEEHDPNENYVCATFEPFTLDGSNKTATKDTFETEPNAMLTAETGEDGLITLSSSTHTGINPDDNTTWTQPQVKTQGDTSIAGGTDVAYINMYYDKEQAVEGKSICRYNHSSICVEKQNSEGNIINLTITPNTTTSTGKVGLECTNCGASTYIVTPIITTDMYYVDAASEDLLKNGAVFNTTVFTVNVMVKDEYKWIMGTQLTNNIQIYHPGNYTWYITGGMNEDGTWNGTHTSCFRLEWPDSINIEPMELQWYKQIESHIYDGKTGILGSVDNFSFINALGQRQEPRLEVYPVYKNSAGQLVPDTTNRITNDPIDVGYYYVKADILTYASDGTYIDYVWKIDGDDGRYTSVTAYGWILPGANAIYVNDSFSDITFTGKDSTYFEFDITQTSLDTSTPGEKNVTFLLTFIYNGDRSQNMIYNTPVTVMARPVTAVPTPTGAGKTGSTLSSLLPNTVNVTAQTLDGKGKTVTDVPVTWNTNSYKPTQSGTQTVTGTLNVDQVPELSNTGITSINGRVTLVTTMVDVDKPTISDYTKTYNGKSTALPLPSMPTGVASTEVLYTGTTAAGKNYSSTTAPTDAGTYTAKVSFTMAVDTNNLIGYNQLDPITVNYKINPYSTTITGSIRDIVYDGTTGILDVANFTYKDVNGTTRNVTATARRVYNSGSGNIIDVFTSIGNPTAVGYYGVEFGASDTNYSFTYNGTTGTSFKEYAFIYPTANSIYVNDSVSDITLNGGSSSYFSYEVSGTSIDSSAAGSKKVQTTIYSIYNGVKKAVNTYDVTVQIKTRAVTAVPTPSATGAIGSASIYDLMPKTVSVTAQSLDGKGKTVANVPVTWDANSFDPTYGSLQTVSGTLDIASVPELNTNGLTTITGQVQLSAQNATRPVINDYTKYYDGVAEPFPKPVTGAGIIDMTFQYTGTTAQGKNYPATTTPPTDAGEYEVTIGFVMAEGYYELDPYIAHYHILPATPECPYPVLVETTHNSLTVEKVPGVKYRINGGAWTDNNVFTGLQSLTSYTIEQYIPASADGNYNASKIMSNIYTTGQHQADVPSFDKQTYTYDGNAKNYVLPAKTEGISSMVIESYNTSDGKAPVNVGTYNVNIRVTPAADYELDITLYVATIEITKGYQDPPNITQADAVADFTSISVPTIPGAQYSLDGWTWQTSGTFLGLNSNATYMIFARMMETENLYASEEISFFVTTKNNSVGAGNAYQVPTESQVHTYDGTAKTYNTDGIILDNNIIAYLYITSYTGMTEGGNSYNSASAPSNAGTYTVNMHLTPHDGYVLDTTEISGTLIINQASQTCAAPVADNITSSVITLKPVASAMYRIDGGAWQSNNVFSGLNAGQTYTLEQYLPESRDGNYSASEIKSAQFTTLMNNASAPTFRAQTYTYDSNAKEYVLPTTLPTGIKSATVTGYDTTDGNAPINVGTYTVTIEIELADGYQLAQTTYTSTLTINKGTQNPPALTNDNVTATDVSITVTQIDGAEYSINNGATWQSSGEFTGLNISTRYTIMARMAETSNLYASDTIILTATTTERMAHVDIDYKLPTDQVYVYDGSRKPLDITGNNMNSDIITTYTIRNYTGTTYAGANYNSTSAPTEAGEYVVTVRIVVADGYALDTEGTTATSVIANLTIQKANRTMTAIPKANSVTSATIVMSPVSGAEYSIDNENWHSSTTFAGLEQGTTYTIYQRYPETGNYYVSNVTSAEFTTTTIASIEYTIDYVNETISYDNSIVKFYVNSSTSIAIPNNGTIRPGNTIYAYLVDGGDGNRGETEAIPLPARGAAPDVVFDQSSKTVNLDNTMEYSTDSGSTWKKATGTLDVSDLIGHAIIVRYAAVEDVSFHSEEVEVDLSIVDIDSDNDGIPDDDDPDDNNDGILDTEDPSHPEYIPPDADGDGKPDSEDDDDDGDGIPDENDPDHPDCIDPDTDGDGKPDSEDDDDDGDGIPDLTDPDDDGDGKPDTEDDDADSDNDGIPDIEDDDDDNDGVPDVNDPDHPDCTDPDTDGDGLLDKNDTDDDNDGIPDTKDNDDDGDGIPDIEDPDADSDGDGIPDIKDTDDDGDGTPDTEDPDHPQYIAPDADDDGIPDDKDNDDDNDGIPDVNDPDHPDCTDPDTDGDGTPDSKDTDDDDDGIPDLKDEDDDNDGIPDKSDPDADSDNDGIPDSEDNDVDGDGIPNTSDPDHPDYDSDGDGIPNSKDNDDDGDGIPDVNDPDHEDCIDPDTDGDGIPNSKDDDDDNDGIPDTEDNDDDGDGILDKNDPDADSDNDGIPDSEDTDDDGDGIPDTIDPDADPDGDGIPNGEDDDDDGDGIPDTYDPEGDPDEDGISNAGDPDDDGDGIPDINDPDHPDYDQDGDGIPDTKDDDDDDDGIPDVNDPDHPDVKDPDSDLDGTPDSEDEDDDNDGIPDIHDPDHPGCTDPDTDGDGLYDSVDEDDDGDTIIDVHDPDHPDYISGCVDNNKDHYCDICKDKITSCADNNDDHRCDICNKIITNCEDADNDHLCDTCDKPLSDCIDINSDEICDICGKDMRTDTDNDGTPDVEDDDDDNDGTLDVDDPNHPEYNPDTDGDGIRDNEDTDDDGDGIPDVNDPDHPDYIGPDADGDGIIDAEDNDDDNDGIPDVNDPDHPDCVNPDSDGDGIPDSEDTDDDNDGIPDINDNDDDGDGIPDTEDADADSDNDGTPDVDDNDDDGDGVPDVNDPDHPLYDQDGDGTPDSEDTDDDGDGIPDVNDPDHEDCIDPDSDGDGIPDSEDTDDDDDGIPDTEDTDDDNDGVPDVNDPDADSDNDGIPDSEDTDDDGDGIPDTEDEDHPDYIGRDTDGDGIPDSEDDDDDGDGIPDLKDTDDDGDGINDVEDPDADSDNDGIPDITDMDDDNDHLPDYNDPDHPDYVGPDTDGDGIIDSLDPDDDNDGIPDLDDPDHPGYNPDTDGDGIRDSEDEDDDNDGIPDSEDDDDDGDGIPDDDDPDHPDYNLPTDNPDGTPDNDNDGIPDTEDPDDNNDGILDIDDPNHPDYDPDSDNDGIRDSEDKDDDGDGIPDVNDPDHPDFIGKDTDGDGIIDAEDDDDDNDGIPDITDNDDDNDGTPDVNDPDADSDNDGIPDTGDTDDDNDGIPDINDPDHPNCLDPDTDGDGIPDSRDDDDDGDGIPDVNDPDHPNFIGKDSDGDGIIDAEDEDDDNDGIPDLTDDDDDNDGINDVNDPDADSDNDGIPDIDDPDDDNDGIPDVNDPNHPSCTDPDSDGDGKPDSEDDDDDNDGIPDDEDDDDNNDGTLDVNDPNHELFGKHGINIKVTNYGPNFASYVEPQGGWITGVNKFTVTSSHACAIALIHNGVMTTLQGTLVADNTYVFSADVVENDEIVIILKGDIDMNGRVNIMDMTRANQYLGGTYRLNDLQKLAADVDLNNRVNIADMTRLNQYLGNVYDFVWTK